MVVTEAFVRLDANVVVGGAGAGRRVGVGGALAGSVIGVVVTGLHAARGGLVGHDVQELKSALVAANVWHVDGHLVRGEGALHLQVRSGGVIVRDVVKEDGDQSLVLIENGNAERRSLVVDGLLPGERSPSRLQVGHSSKTPLSRFRSAGGIFVASVVALDMLAVLAISISRSGALPSSVRTHNHQIGAQNSQQENKSFDHFWNIDNKDYSWRERKPTSGQVRLHQQASVEPTTEYALLLNKHVPKRTLI